jgi:hypothetical protein
MCVTDHRLTAAVCSYEEEDTCVSDHRLTAAVCSYEEEDTCVSQTID